MSDDRGDDDDVPSDINYEGKVGYCQPPLHTRWKKGFCPNPAGRPRKVHTRKYYLEKAAYRKIWAKDGQRRRQMTVLEAILLIVKAKAVINHAGASKLNDKLRGITMRAFESGPQKGVLFLDEKLTEEEWFEEYGHLGEPKT